MAKRSEGESDTLRLVRDHWQIVVAVCAAVAMSARADTTLQDHARRLTAAEVSMHDTAERLARLEQSVQDTRATARRIESKLDAPRR